MDETQAVVPVFWSVSNWQLWVAVVVLIYFCTGLFFRWSGYAEDIRSEYRYGVSADRELVLFTHFLIFPPFMAVAIPLFTTVYVVSAGLIDVMGIGDQAKQIKKTISSWFSREGRSVG